MINIHQGTPRGGVDTARFLRLVWSGAAFAQKSRRPCHCSEYAGVQAPKPALRLWDRLGGESPREVELRPL